MIELILVRHGETDSNKRGTYLGWTDVELNEEGIKQAHRAKDKLKGIKIDGIFSSPLLRARRTAEIINEHFNLELVCSDNLKERNFGIWDDLTYKDITEKYPEEHQAWVNDWINYCVRDGESSDQAYQRIRSFVDELIAAHSSGVYLIVTHLGCIRKIMAHLLDMSIEGSWHFRVDNAGITRLQINDEKYAYLTLLNG